MKLKKLSETTLKRELIDILGEDFEIKNKDVVNMDDVNYVKLGLVAKFVGKNFQTIKHWGEFAKQKNIPFPEANTTIDKRGTRYFKEEDIDTIINFGKNISYGSMSDYNVNLWGERGKNIEQKNTSRYKEDKAVSLSNN